MSAKYEEKKKRTRPPQARFSPEQVNDIRKRSHNGELLREIASDYNATPSCIQRIVRGLAYKDLPMFPLTPPYSRPRGIMLTHDDVREIRRRRASGEYNKVVAYAFKISEQTASAIYTRKLYKHVADEVL